MIKKLYFYTSKDKKCIVDGCNNLGKRKGKKNNQNQEYKCIFCDSHLSAYHRKVFIKRKKTKAEFDNEIEQFVQKNKDKKKYFYEYVILEWQKKDKWWRNIVNTPYKTKKEALKILKKLNSFETYNDKKSILGRLVYVDGDFKGLKHQNGGTKDFEQ